MKPESGQIKSVDLLCGLQDQQDLLELSHMVVIDALVDVVLEQVSQSLVAEAADHPPSSGNM